MHRLHKFGSKQAQTVCYPVVNEVAVTAQRVKGPRR
jgi:hypothetical protein